MNDRVFILCYVRDDGTICPQGFGKSFEHAKELSEMYKKAGREDWKLFELVEVTE